MKCCFQPTGANPIEKVSPKSAGGLFNAIKGYFGSHIGEGEIDCGQFNTPKRIRNAPTCCLLSRRTVFDRIGMMDAKYFVYHDDADFLFRAWRAGLKMFYTPRARIFHKVSSLTGATTRPLPYATTRADTSTSCSESWSNTLLLLSAGSPGSDVFQAAVPHDKLERVCHSTTCFL